MGANFGITLIGSNGVSAGLNYGQMKSKGTLYIIMPKYKQEIS